MYVVSYMHMLFSISSALLKAVTSATNHAFHAISAVTPINHTYLQLMFTPTNYLGISLCGIKSRSSIRVFNLCRAMQNAKCLSDVGKGCEVV